MNSTYDKHPFVPVTAQSSDCTVGWREILQCLAMPTGVICVECYPGVFEQDLVNAIGDVLPWAQIIRSKDYFLPPATIEALVSRDLTDDPVFGRLSGLSLTDFLDPQRLESVITQIANTQNKLLFIVGTGAIFAAPHPDLLVYADLARWEIQQRQRRSEISTLGVENKADNAAKKYKQAFFVDWRVADRLKKELLPSIDVLLDTNDRNTPKSISGTLLRQGLFLAAHRPFRVVPFFDPGPWGGQWMRKVCGLPDGPPNYAWCFDCVPEENSVLLGFGAQRVEVPSIDLVFAHPRELLGDAVHARFGTEFPIRFDFLDTMGGGNLSLQVHPLTEYIQEHFGMHYTQDESYYLLDAAPDACVYLGLKEGIDGQAMARDLQAAQKGGPAFSTEQYVNVWPAKKHDHFSIPAGTVHCSGRNSMVLEISATPYIFTFKLWDWQRLGLDGRPRPIHLQHGLRNIQWDRTTDWVRRELIDQVQPLCSGVGWREERTGLHRREFIETRRHWFTEPVPHHAEGGVNVLNLVEGAEAIVESPTHAFDPLIVHYAETFIVPASVGAYTVRPATASPTPSATVKAFVRTSGSAAYDDGQDI